MEQARPPQGAVRSARTQHLAKQGDCKLRGWFNDPHLDLPALLGAMLAWHQAMFLAIVPYSRVPKLRAVAPERGRNLHRNRFTIENQGNASDGSIEVHLSLAFPDLEAESTAIVLSVCALWR